MFVDPGTTNAAFTAAAERWRIADAVWRSNEKFNSDLRALNRSFETKYNKAISWYITRFHVNSAIMLWKTKYDAEHSVLYLVYKAAWEALVLALPIPAGSTIKEVLYAFILTCENGTAPAASCELYRNHSTEVYASSPKGCYRAIAAEFIRLYEPGQATQLALYISRLSKISDYGNSTTDMLDQLEKAMKEVNKSQGSPMSSGFFEEIFNKAVHSPFLRVRAERIIADSSLHPDAREYTLEMAFAEIRAVCLRMPEVNNLGLTNSPQKETVNWAESDPNATDPEIFLPSTVPNTSHRNITTSGAARNNSGRSGRAPAGSFGRGRDSGGRSTSGSGRVPPRHVTFDNPARPSGPYAKPVFKQPAPRGGVYPPCPRCGHVNHYVSVCHFCDYFLLSLCLNFAEL